MKVYLFKSTEEPRLVEIENKLEVLQELVDGNIEVIELIDGWKKPYILVCNEDGKNLNLEENRTVFIDGNSEFAEKIYGDFFVCREDEEDFAGIVKNDLECIMKYIGGSL